MEKAKTVVFIGHNDCYGITSDMVIAEITRHIENGAVYFLSGGQGGFDRMCAGCVSRLKKIYPHIRNVLVIPYLTFGIFDKSIFDEIIYPEGFEKYHFKAAIRAKNKYMVNCADYAICFVRHDWGGAAQTYLLAQKNQLTITNLADRMQTLP